MAAVFRPEALRLGGALIQEVFAYFAAFLCDLGGQELFTAKDAKCAKKPKIEIRTPLSSVG